MKIPILKEFERFEWFEWFGPSPIEPFNPGADSGRCPAVRGVGAGRSGDAGRSGALRARPWYLGKLLKEGESLPL